MAGLQVVQISTGFTRAHIHTVPFIRPLILQRCNGLIREYCTLVGLLICIKATTPFVFPTISKPNRNGSSVLWIKCLTVLCLIRRRPRHSWKKPFALRTCLRRFVTCLHNHITVILISVEMGYFMAVAFQCDILLFTENKHLYYGLYMQLKAIASYTGFQA